MLTAPSLSRKVFQTTDIIRIKKTHAVFFNAFVYKLKRRQQQRGSTVGLMGDGGKKLLKVSISCLYMELKATHWETFFLIQE